MPDNEEFFKELMGEEKKSDGRRPDGYEDWREDGGYAPPEEPQPGGFTVEYVDDNGRTIDREPARFGKKEKNKPDPRDLPEEVVGPKDFDVDFDFDKEYENVNEKPIKRGRSKRTGCLGGVLYFIFIIAVSVALACVGWMAATDVLGLGDENEVVEITLPKTIFSEAEREKANDEGVKEKKTVTVADMDYVANLLHENGLIKYKWLFKLYAKFATADEKVSAGTYQVNMNYDYRALVNGLSASGGTKVEIEVTVPEGYTLKQIVQLFVDKKVCDEEELWNVLANHEFDYEFLSADTLGDKYRLEGYLFPDTYKFYVGDSPTRTINKMLKNFAAKWTDEFSAKAETMGYSMNQILTVASMIEKEAGADPERATIASVIYNRLDNPDAKTVGLLQIDATILYAMARDGVTGGVDTQYDSPYNTYQNKGLPPGPIANPGMASIKAALNPEKTGYFYYALGLEGTHEFFKTYDSFTAFVQSDKYGG